ncbi:hypothetical protein L195_g038258, partial [Trifolium pratense]
CLPPSIAIAPPSSMIRPTDNNFYFLDADLCLDTPPMSSEYAEVSVDVVEVIGLVKEILRRQLLRHRSTTSGGLTRSGGGLVDSRLVVAWWTVV